MEANKDGGTTAAQSRRSDWGQVKVTGPEWVQPEPQWEDIKAEFVKSKEFDFDYEFVFEWLKEHYLAPEKK